MKLYRAIALTALSAVFCCERCHSVDIDVSSLTSGYDFTAAVSQTTWYANAFRTLNYSGLGTVDQVYLRLAAIDMNKAADLTVRIYNDNGGMVGQTVMDTFAFASQPVMKDGVATALYQSTNSGAQLPANSKYWLVVAGTANLATSASWLGRYAASEIPGLNANILPDVDVGYNMMFTNNGGQTWQGCWVSLPNCKMMEFSINAPEPSTYVLGTIITVVLALTARNPRRRAMLHRSTESESIVLTGE